MSLEERVKRIKDIELMEKAHGQFRWRIFAQFAIFCLLLVSAGCGLGGYQSTIFPAGPVAEKQVGVFYVTVIISVVIFFIVGSVYAYCIYKYRHEGDIEEGTPYPPQAHGDPLVEMGLIFISVALVGVIAVPTLQTIFWLDKTPDEMEAVEVKVTGFQWWWKFEYPQYGVVTANEFAIPAGRPVHFELETADVTHSFWIPRLGGKMDLTPGQVNTMWLQADRSIAKGEVFDDGEESSGVLYGQCVEFCGESHAFMRMRTLVLNQSDFDVWVKAQAADAAAPQNATQELGKKLFGQRCASCHAVRGDFPGAGGAYPDLTHHASRTTIGAGILPNTRENLREWIQNPNHVKPGNLMYSGGYLDPTQDVEALKEGYDFSNNQDELNALVEYLKNLK